MGREQPWSTEVNVTEGCRGERREAESNEGKCEGSEYVWDGGASSVLVSGGKKKDASLFMP